MTLVPDDPAQGTSDHGWEVAKHQSLLKDVIARLHASKMRESLFVDADPKLAEQAKAVGADRIEIYTGPYGGAFDSTCGRANSTSHCRRKCGGVCRAWP